MPQSPNVSLERELGALFLSAFTPDAQLDFTQPAQRLGADVPVMVGRDSIAGIMHTLAPLDTTHTVTNPRIELGGDEAVVVRADDSWKIRSLVIRNIWYDGDPAVLFDRVETASS